MLLAVAPMSDIPDALLLNINTNSEQKHTTPQSGRVLSASDDDIDHPKAPINSTQRSISVVVYTPSKTPVPAPASRHLHPSTSQIAEPQIPDEDADSAWSQTNYGNLDWDHSGDEYEDIMVTPKLTRNWSSISPCKLQPIPLLPFADAPGSSNIVKAMEEEMQEKKDVGAQRHSNGRFVSKENVDVLDYQPSTPLNRKRRASNVSKVSSGSQARGESPSKEGSSSKEKRPSSSGSAKRPSSRLRDAHGRFAPNEGSSSKRQRTLSSASSQVPNETPVLLPKQISILDKPTLRSAHYRDSSGKFLSSVKKGLISSLENVTPSRLSTASDNGTSQQRDPSGRFLTAQEPSISQPAFLVTRPGSLSSETFEDEISLLASNSRKQSSLKKETPIPPPPVRSYLTSSSPLGKTSKAQPASPVTGITSSPPLPVPKPKLKRAPAKSPYFPSTPKKAAKTIVSPLKPPSSQKRLIGLSCIPFPPLASPTFGLIQEKLAQDPFKLLIAVTFLIRTHGKHAIPIFYKLMQKFPTPEALLAADKERDILPIIQHLGLQNQRASTYQMYAKIWLENPPRQGRRYKVLGYPGEGDGRDVGKDEALDDEDVRVGWEIGHMTQGPYALDSWRIFCRDKLRGLADGWNGEGASECQKRASSSEHQYIDLEALESTEHNDKPKGTEQEDEEIGKAFQPEWMRVLPLDKELRAYLRWMWLKEGFEWDPFTGDKEVASPELMTAAIEGRLEWDETGGMRIVDKVDGESEVEGDGRV